MNEEKTDFFCPMPLKWNEIYQSLLKVWEKQGASVDDKPPVPLILAAWHETTGLQKLLRWKDTLQWAEKHNCLDSIPELKEEEKFTG